MKRVFVLDENVFIQSHNCRSIDNSEDDFNSLNLIINILDKCHKIGLNYELRSKYKEKSKTLKKCASTAIAVRVWARILGRNDKQVFCESHQTSLPANVRHDSHVVDPALFLSAILVTTDEKLKKRLLEWAEKEKHEISIKSPKEAVTYLSQSENYS